LKIILINPRSKNPDEAQQKCFAPINLLYLASSLLEAGHQVDVIDANALGLSDEDVAEKTKSLRPDLIGVSLLSEVFIQAHTMVKRIHLACPTAKIVLGGPHAGAFPEKVMEEFKEVNYVLTGESERSIIHLCKFLDNKIPADQVKGMYYREDGKILHIRVY